MLELASKKRSVQMRHTHTFRTFDSTSISFFTAFLASFDWTDFVKKCKHGTYVEMESLYDNFFEIFFDKFENAFPLKTSTQTKAQRLAPPWLTNQLLKCCKKKMPASKI